MPVSCAECFKFGNIAMNDDELTLINSDGYGCSLFNSAGE